MIYYILAQGRPDVARGKKLRKKILKKKNFKKIYVSRHLRI